ncbi:phosphotransferase family protein [Deinococcus roseus]|uniref:Aminoglycoside phosphotransferase n=1 Tax=Deinococcus roseus TaxID=392414 RepID=A0ABQ2DC69_9DEIO|nr:aminoglycoside phosphotransferase family protein [Deinococcus roseus]GGJ52513.1 aminoglycoside phosphotransferase [Deinococcus roseus]
MESKTKNLKTRSQIAQMTARAFPETTLADHENAIQELKDGWFNAGYLIQLADGREVVLKIAPPAGAEVMQYEKDIMTTEVHTMRLVKANPRIPVPEIHFYDPSHEVCDSSYFFMEKITGDTLEHLKGHLPAETWTELEQQTGQVVREINTFQGTYFGYEGNEKLRAATWKDAFLKIFEAVLEDAEKKDVQFDFSYQEIRDTLHRHLPALEDITSPCLVHWDGWNPNFFARDDKIIGIIDFERALWAEPLMEAQFRPFFGEGITQQMRGYGKTEFTFAEEQRMHLYSLHLGLVMHVECHYRHYDTDDIFNFSRTFIADTMQWLKEH